MGKLVIDGNKVYEIDESCLEKKRRAESEKQKENGHRKKRRYGWR